LGVKNIKKFKCNEYIGYGEKVDKILSGWVVIDFTDGQHYIG